MYAGAVVGTRAILGLFRIFGQLKILPLQAEKTPQFDLRQNN